jgi:hypothetical protein
MRSSWKNKNAHAENEKLVDNHAFMWLHLSSQLEVTVLRIACTIIIQFLNLELHISVWSDPCLTSHNGSSMIRNSRIIHLKRRDHPVDLEKKGFLIILRRDTKNNNVRDVRGVITKKEHAKIHYLVMQKMPWILE